MSIALPWWQWNQRDQQTRSFHLWPRRVDTTTAKLKSYPGKKRGWLHWLQENKPPKQSPAKVLHRTFPTRSSFLELRTRNQVTHWNVLRWVGGWLYSQTTQKHRLQRTGIWTGKPAIPFYQPLSSSLTALEHCAWKANLHPSPHSTERHPTHPLARSKSLMMRFQGKHPASGPDFLHSNGLSKHTLVLGPRQSWNPAYVLSSQWSSWRTEKRKKRFQTSSRQIRLNVHPMFVYTLYIKIM